MDREDIVRTVLSGVENRLRCIQIQVRCQRGRVINADVEATERIITYSTDSAMRLWYQLRTSATHRDITA